MKYGTGIGEFDYNKQLALYNKTKVPAGGSDSAFGFDKWTKNMLGDDFSLFGSTSTDKNGASVKSNGMLDYGGMIMDGYLGLQKNGLMKDQLKLAQEKSAFAQKEFWTNIAMKQDFANRKINNRTSHIEWAGGKGDDYALANEFNRGDAIVRSDRSEYNTIDVPQEHLGAGYAPKSPASQTTPQGPNSAFATPHVTGIAPPVQQARGIPGTTTPRNATPVGQAQSNKQKKLT